MKLGPSQRRFKRGAHFGLAGIWAETESVAKLNSLGLVRHHATQAIRSIGASAVTSSLTVITIALALALLGCVIMLFENTGAYLNAAGGQMKLSMFLRDGVSDVEIQALIEEVRKSPNVERVVQKSKAQALEQFKKDLGSQAVLMEGLEASNPLPASLEINFRADAGKNVFADFADKFSKNKLIEQVEYNQGVLSQLGELLESVRVGGMLAIIAVICMAVFIIGSTIKLALFARRDEIEIMQLVGATDAFVRSPYMIEGAMQGVFGSILGLAVVYSVHAMLQQAIERSSFFSLLISEFSFLSVFSVLLVLILGLFVGLCGSYLTLRKFRVE